MRHLFLVIYVTACIHANGQWIDPHTMDTKVKHRMKDVLDDSVVDSCSVTKEKPICHSDIHFRRIVRVLLNNAYFDDKKSSLDFLTGHINVQLSAADYDFLMEFSKRDDADSKTFKEVQSMLETALQKTAFEKYSEWTLSMQERLYLMLNNPGFLALLACVLVLSIFYRLLKADLTLSSIVVFFAVVLFVADFVILYLQLLEEEQIDGMVKIKQAGMMPPECDPAKMSWGNYLKFFFNKDSSENDCRAYYRATHQQMKYYVAPLRVFHIQFGNFIVQPLKYMGEGVGKFTNAAFSELPWGLNIILAPVLLLLSVFIVCVFLVFATKTPLRINLYPVFQFELGSSQTPSARNQVTSRSISAPEHRPMVENVPEINAASPAAITEEKAGSSEAVTASGPCEDLGKTGSEESEDNIQTEQ